MVQRFFAGVRGPASPRGRGGTRPGDYIEGVHGHRPWRTLPPLYNPGPVPPPPSGGCWVLDPCRPRAATGSDRLFLSHSPKTCARPGSTPGPGSPVPAGTPQGPIGPAGYSPPPARLLGGFFPGGSWKHPGSFPGASVSLWGLQLMCGCSRFCQQCQLICSTRCREPHPAPCTMPRAAGPPSHSRTARRVMPGCVYIYIYSFLFWWGFGFSVLLCVLIGPHYILVGHRGRKLPPRGSPGLTIRANRAGPRPADFQAFWGKVRDRMT